MGLDTTHGCWHASYLNFFSWRVEIARCIGIDLMRMEGYFRGVQLPPPDNAWVRRNARGKIEEVFGPVSWDLLVDPLKVLLSHSDTDGQIDVPDLLPLATRLGNIKPAMPEIWHEATQRFIDGLYAAATADEPVEFG